MEKLVRIKVAGFRSLKDVDLQLTSLNVLIGANGAGKSNLIDFFNLISYMLSGSLQLYLGRRGGAASNLHYGPPKTPLLQTELRFEGDHGWSEYRGMMAFASPDRLIFTDEVVSFQRSPSEKPFARSLGSGHFESKLLELAQDPKGVGETARVFIERLRGLRVYHFHDTSDTAHIRVMQDLGKDRFLLSHGGNLATFLYLLSEQFPKHFTRIVETIRFAVPYFQEFILEPSRFHPGKIMLRWRDRSPENEFAAHQLSDGSLRAIALITTLLQPEELLPSVIIIDEPELGLHPGAVTLIGQLILAASENRQVIVATQSPRLLSQLRPEDVVVVEREEDRAGFGQSSFRRLSKDALGGWLDDYELGSLFEMNVTGGGPL
jgi:predicted ATPase